MAKTKRPPPPPTPPEDRTHGVLTPTPPAQDDSPPLAAPPATEAAARDLGHTAVGKVTRARTARMTNKRLLAARGHEILALTAKQQSTRTVLAKVQFLREFARCGIILRAAQSAHVGRKTVYDWREDDPAFVQLMADAHEDAMDLLEEEARRRGHDGVIEPVFQGGREVGSIRKYSDHLLMMFLKGKRRAEFSERTETTGPNGAPLAPAVVMVSWHQSMKPPEQP
jgi:uncharacterized protein YbjQ (UPF0145 family)